ncbi:MAG TPA: hypothetical protein VN634_06565 [Candidatus Limnocylindrales bacterium]|nr:hypothetical protein [Candidatus Limnocylindrales bacterium]
MRDRMLVGFGVGALMLAAGSGIAAAEDEPAPNTGNFSVTFQNDFTTAYYFRGILQENDGGIWEPSLGLAWKLYSSEDGPLRSASIGLGTWESVHSTHTLASGNGPKAWYEADVYPSVSMSWAGGVSTGLTYYFYTSPNGGFSTTEEVDVSLGFDDSPYLDKFALHPSLTLAWEVKGTSFSDFHGNTCDGSGNACGHGTGSLAILAIAPSYALFSDSSYPLTLTLPVSVALSMDDYYKTDEHNETFGYAALGLTANIPLAFIPKRYGTWSVTNGLNVLFLNDALEDVNSTSLTGGPDVQPVWTSSIIMTY